MVLFILFGAVSEVVSIIRVGLGLFYKDKNATEPELVLADNVFGMSLKTSTRKIEELKQSFWPGSSETKKMQEVRVELKTAEQEKITACQGKKEEEKNG